MSRGVLCIPTASCSPLADFLPAGVSIADAYRELKSVASIYLRREESGHTLQPTALVHEALIRLAKSGRKCAETSLARWANPAEFFRLAAVAMQRVLIEHARSKCALRRGGPGRSPGQAQGGWVPGHAVPEEWACAAANVPAVPIEDLQEAMGRLEAMDPRAAEVVRLRFFMGLTIGETAGLLGISTATAESDWRIARAWLGRVLGQTGR